MSLLVWTMMGIAIWHFAVFVPDRFKGGIVGAFGCAALGAVIVGVALAGGDIDEHEHHHGAPGRSRSAPGTRRLLVLGRPHRRATRVGLGTAAVPFGRKRIRPNPFLASASDRKVGGPLAR